MEGKYAVKLSITELIKLKVGNERNVIMVACGKCKRGLTPPGNPTEGKDLEEDRRDVGEMN